jgi:hypothetical protein
VSQVTHQLDDFQRNARRITREAHRWVEAFARIGYAAKSVVYCLVGLIAIFAAIGMSREVADQRGVMHAILAQPLGRTMLLILAVGLVCYTLWYFVQAIVDPEHSGRDWKGLAKRAGKFFKGVLHASFVAVIFRLITGLRVERSTDSAAKDWTAFFMSFPLGIWLVGAGGLGFVGYGIYQLYRGWKIKLDDQLDLSKLSSTARKCLIGISRFGLYARGVLFGVIGTFLLIAAMRANPQEARGVAAAMRALERQPYGSLLLAGVALGLIAYGVYELLRARYRRIAE